MHYISMLWLLAMVFSITSASTGINPNQRAARTRRTASDDQVTADQLLKGNIDLLTSLKESSPKLPLMDEAIGALQRIIRGNTCPDSFKNIGGCCYYFSITDVSLPNLTWYAAAKACQDYGKTLKLTANLAEVGLPQCDDTELMEYIGQKGVDYTLMWFGAKRNTKDNNWTWQQTNRDFSVNSNMWWPTAPGDRIDDNCLLSLPGGADTVAPRAYFGNSLCTNKYQYVCQIFD